MRDEEKKQSLSHGFSSSYLDVTPESVSFVFRSSECNFYTVPPQIIHIVNGDVLLVVFI